MSKCARCGIDLFSHKIAEASFFQIETNISTQKCSVFQMQDGSSTFFVDFLLWESGFTVVGPGSKLCITHNANQKHFSFHEYFNH